MPWKLLYSTMILNTISLPCSQQSQGICQVQISATLHIVRPCFWFSHHNFLPFFCYAREGTLSMPFHPWTSSIIIFGQGQKALIVVHSLRVFQVSNALQPPNLKSQLPNLLGYIVQKIITINTNTSCFSSNHGKYLTLALWTPNPTSNSL